MILKKYNKKSVDKESVKALVEAILELREKARRDKDWEAADNIRKDLEDIGFEIQDTTEGPVWRKR